VRGRVLRALRRAGKWSDEGGAADVELDGEQQLLLALASGAVTGRAALGERAGEGDARVGRGTRSEPFVKAPLCADCDGFSLHAGVRVPAGDRKRLEHLLRYAGRPAIVLSRLSLLPDGRVCYELKRRWRPPPHRDQIWKGPLTYRADRGTNRAQGHCSCSKIASRRSSESSCESLSVTTRRIPARAVTSATRLLRQSTSKLGVRQLTNTINTSCSANLYTLLQVIAVNTRHPNTDTLLQR
jgi:hypothetical protein